MFASDYNRKLVSIMFDTGCQKTEFLEINVRQWIFILGQFIRIIDRDRDGKIRRHARRKQTCPAQFVNPRQIAYFLQAEMV